jgi:hypothetical protein
VIRFLGRIGGGGEALLGLALTRREVEGLGNGCALCLSVGDLGASLREEGTRDAEGRGAVLVFQAEEDEVAERFREIRAEEVPSP